MRRLLLAALLLAVTASAEDSPLVAAAKKTNRGAPRSKVRITNDTLTKSGGRITTTATLRPIPNVAATTPATEPAATQSAPKPPEKPKPRGGKPKADPVDDAMIPEDEGASPENIRDPYPTAILPANATAQPQMTQPKVVAPVEPQQSQPPPDSPPR